MKPPLLVVLFIAMHVMSPAPRISQAPAAILEIQPSSTSGQRGTPPQQPQTLYDGLIDAIVAQWPIVAIGIATLIVIRWQAREMADATRAMRESTKEVKRQADLQEAAMEQWVNIDEWDVDVPLNANKLSFRFKLWNPTKFPIAIKNSLLVFSVPNLEIKHSFGENSRLVPSMPITAKIEMTLTDEQARRFDEGWLVVGVSGFLEHTDMGPKKSVVQPVIGNLMCGKDGARFDPQQMTPIQALQQDRDLQT